MFEYGMQRRQGSNLVIFFLFKAIVINGIVVAAIDWFYYCILFIRLVWKNKLFALKKRAYIFDATVFGLEGATHVSIGWMYEIWTMILSNETFQIFSGVQKLKRFRQKNYAKKNEREKVEKSDQICLLNIVY